MNGPRLKDQDAFGEAAADRAVAGHARGLSQGVTPVQRALRQRVVHGARPPRPPRPAGLRGVLDPAAQGGRCRLRGMSPRASLAAGPAVRPLRAAAHGEARVSRRAPGVRRRLGGGRLHRRGARPRGGAEVPSRASAGRRHGSPPRRRRPGLAARGGDDRAGSRASGARAGAGVRPGEAARRRARAAHGRAAGQGAAPPRARPGASSARRAPSASSAGGSTCPSVALSRPAWCSSTTCTRRARRSTRAPARCAGRVPRRSSR